MRKRRPIRAALPHFLVVLKKIPVPGQALPEKVSGQMWRTLALGYRLRHADAVHRGGHDPACISRPISHGAVPRGDPFF